MDPFVRRLVERLLDPSRPLSRNRHFHTFETPEGQRALRISRRLAALKRDIAACLAEGGSCRAAHLASASGRGPMQVEVRLEHPMVKRRAILDASEFELLCRLPGAVAIRLE